MITSLLPAWLETRICLRLRQHGLNPVYLVQCLFLLCSLFLCVAYSCAVVDEKRSHHWCDTIRIESLQTSLMGSNAWDFFLTTDLEATVYFYCLCRKFGNWAQVNTVSVRLYIEQYLRYIVPYLLPQKKKTFGVLGENGFKVLAASSSYDDRRKYVSQKSFVWVAWNGIVKKSSQATVSLQRKPASFRVLHLKSFSRFATHKCLIPS